MFILGGEFISQVKQNDVSNKVQGYEVSHFMACLQLRCNLFDTFTWMSGWSTLRTQSDEPLLFVKEWRDEKAYGQTSMIVGRRC